jgi:two-component system chemotaxis response regulator CheY
MRCSDGAWLEREPVDLIFLDMRMPVLDGWAFAREYRRRPGEHAPIICMTAEAEIGQRGRDIGADGILPKPFDIGDLFALLEQFGETKA